MLLSVKNLTLNLLVIFDTDVKIITHSNSVIAA